MTRTYRLIMLLAVLASPGCLHQNENELGSPTDPSSNIVDTAEIFSGTLTIGGSQSYGFPVTQAASVTVMLASLTVGNTTLSLPVGLLFGTISADGVTCNGTSTQTVTPSLTTQITQAAVPGNYCVTLSDSAGVLTGETKFAVRIRQTANASTLGQAGTETFSSNIYPGVFINRTFGVTATGEVKVSLTGVTPQASIGLGLGVTNNSVDDCYLNKVVVTTPGASALLTATAEAGAFCVKVFDVGGLPDRVNFNVQISHP